MTFQERLELAMTEAKVDRATLARDTHVAYQTIDRALRGKQKSFDTANNFKIARRLGVSPRWLAYEEGDMAAKEPSAMARDVSEWFDDVRDPEKRERAHSIIYQMLVRDRWPKLEPFEPEPAPKPKHVKHQ